MGLKFASFVIACFLFFCSLQEAISGDLNQVFNQLKDREFEQLDVGSLCEKVAELELEKLFPSPSYDIVVGIEFGDSERILGELDVVVFDAITSEAVLIEEVKCWNDLRKAKVKATKQLEHFTQIAHTRTDIDFYLKKDTSIHYQPWQFRSNFKTLSVSQKSLGSRFDITLDLSLSEITKLEAMLRRYRKHKKTENHIRSRSAFF